MNLNYDYVQELPISFINFWFCENNNKIQFKFFSNDKLFLHLRPPISPPISRMSFRSLASFSMFPESILSSLLSALITETIYYSAGKELSTK